MRDGRREKLNNNATIYGHLHSETHSRRPLWHKALVIFTPDSRHQQTHKYTIRSLLAVRGILLRGSSTLNGKCHMKIEREGKEGERNWEERRHERGGEKKRRWQCLREQTSPPVWLPDSKEQTGGEGRRMSRAVCVYVCRGAASLQPREGHLSVSAPLGL